MAELQRGRLDAAEAVRRERESSLRETRALEQALARELQEARHSERECSSKLDDIARNRALASEQLERIADELTERRETLLEIDEVSVASALQEAVALRAAREAALAESRNTRGRQRALRGLEEDRQRTEHAAAPQRERVADLRLRVQAAELAEGQHAARLEEAQADEALLAPLLTPDIKEGSLQRELARLGREIAELGAVNLAALDELQRLRAQGLPRRPGRRPARRHRNPRRCHTPDRQGDPGAASGDVQYGQSSFRQPVSHAVRRR
jgi:chromosome segregation protein